MVATAERPALAAKMRSVTRGQDSVTALWDSWVQHVTKCVERAPMDSAVRYDVRAL